MAALAAEAADESPRASMSAATRLPTVGMNASLYQASSTIGFAGCPPAVAKRMSGYIVGEWFPHTIIFSNESTGLPVFVASCESARLWSRRSIAVKHEGFRDFALFIAM